MKKIFVLIFLLIPNVIFAAENECDYSKQVELGKLASNITYETKYNKSDKNFDVTLYNVIDGLYLDYKESIYNGNTNHEVTIQNISQGTTMTIVAKTAITNCDTSLLTIYINLPYYNPYYETEECENYKNKLTVCSSQFLSYEINEDIFKGAIRNYEEKIKNEPQKPQEEVKKTFLTNIKEFALNWGVKIGLVVLSTAIAIIPFRVIFRKIKHKI